MELAKETWAIMPTQVTHEIKNLSFLQDSTMSIAVI